MWATTIPSMRQRECSPSIEIGVAIEPEKVNVLVVAASAGKQADHLRAIAAKHQHQRTTFHRNFGPRLQIVQAGNDFGQIAGAPVFFIVCKQARSTVAIVHDLVADSLQFFDDSGSTQRGRGSFRPGRKPAALEGAPIKAIFFG